MLSQVGLAGVTLGVLADRVGMSKSGLFAHFRSKEDVQLGLLTYMGHCARQQVVAPAMRAAEGLPGRSDVLVVLAWRVLRALVLGVVLCAEPEAVGSLP